MEEPEAKIHRTQSSSMMSKSKSKSTSHIPLHLTSEILLRLPAKSVVRFRCVSKLWSSITTDPSFINSFNTRSSTKPSLLLCFKEGDEMFVFSAPQHHHQNESDSSCSSQLIDRYHIDSPNHGYFSITESVQGLICFEESGKPIIWNPSTGKFLTLPKPEMSWKKTKVFLGYDPIEGKHKVVCMRHGENRNECRVSTLGSPQEEEESIWRSVKVKTNDSFPDFTASSNGRCINGVLYYRVMLNHGPVIMRFDVRSEKLDTIELPSQNLQETLITYEGKLACVERDDNMNNGIKLWILEDAEKKHEWWSKEFSAPFLHYDQSSGTSVILNGVTDDAGEFVYAPNGFTKSFFVLFRDMERNSFRKVDFKGIVDDEFMISHGVGRSRVYVLHTFPNHIESLKPF